MEFIRRKKQAKNKRYLLIIIVGIFLVFIGLLVIIYKYYENQQLDNIDNQMIKDFFNEKNEIVDVVEEQEKNPTTITKQEKYIAVLEIPKIDLRKGLVDRNSYRNNVNRNIYMLNETTLPTEQANSHIILAAHSGNSYISYFKNLNKLNINDIIYFYYKDIKYVYEVSNRYEIEKTGTMELKQTDTSDITLITCINGTNKQFVFVGKLISKEGY